MKKYLSIIQGLFFSALIVFFSAGCGSSGDKAEKQTRLDSLWNVLHQLEKNLDGLGRESIQETYLSCKENLKELHLVFQQDALAVDETQLLQYENLTVNLNHLVADIDNIEKEIQFAMQQIAEWNTSLQKKKVISEDFEHYVKTETEATRSLAMILNTKKQEWQNLQAQIKQLNPEIKKLIHKK